MCKLEDHQLPLDDLLFLKAHQKHGILSKAHI